MHQNYNKPTDYNALARYLPIDTHEGQGERLVPPHTRGHVSISVYISLLRLVHNVRSAC
jgi:hypothetical protein